MTAGRAQPVMTDQPAAEIPGADRRDRRPRAASGTKPAAGVIVVDRSGRANRRRVRPPLPPAFDVTADMGGIGESHVRSPLLQGGSATGLSATGARERCRWSCQYGVSEPA